MSMYPSIDTLKDSKVIVEISKKINDILEVEGQAAPASSLIKASKNAVSLFLSKKKGTPPALLSVYVPKNVISSCDDTVVPTVSSDEDVSETSLGEEDDSINTDSSCQFSSCSSHSSPISFSINDDVVKAITTFEYLYDYFKHSLSINNRPMNLEKIVTDVCTYVFLELKCSINIR